MMHLQNLNYAVVLKQQSATNGATLTSDAIDTKGFDELTIILHSTTADAASNKPATLKLTESDDTVATNHANISGALGGTDFTIPNMPTATTTAPYARFSLNLTKRKRYIKLLVSPVTTQTFSAIGILGRAEELPDTIAEQNIGVSVIV